jgi:NADH dehydrogenase/NADH:ubiquinone oxidoreductase subunit G
LRFQRIATPFGRGTTSAQPLTWEKALKRALSAQQLSKASEMLLVCGNNASLETSQILQKIGQTLGIPVISEQFAAQDSSLVFMSQLNVPVASIAESDLVVTLGANVRMEASLLNIRLKNRFNEGNFVKASIGVGENDTYKTVSLGHSLSVLCQIAEGRHPFCKQFLKAKKPLLIIGTAVTKRVDAAAIFGCVGTLKRFTNLTGGS